MIRPKAWGYEEKIFSTNRRLIINEQHKTSIHKHSVEELLFVDSGVIAVELGDSPESLDSLIFVDENNKIIIPSGKWHRVISLNDSVIFDFSKRTDEDTIKQDKSFGGKIEDEEFKRYLESYLKKQQKDRILTLERATTLSSSFRQNGRIVGYCSGVFDLFHFGHLEFLSQAKSRCDILFVGVYTDSATKGIKGEHRPVINEVGRFSMVESNRYVNYVVEVDELDSSNAISSIKPDIYITTEDYASPAEVKAVTENKGKVNIIPTIKGWNTTKLIMSIGELKKNVSKKSIINKKAGYVPPALNDSDMIEIKL